MIPSHDLVRAKVQAGITTLAWVASEYYKINQDWTDADDYIQTMIIFESIVANDGYNHEDLVARYRVDRPTKIKGDLVLKNGAEHVGQLYRLRQDPNPKYLATTGFTSGCAMKALPLGVWHREYHNTVFMADSVTRVTHGTDEARLIGLLTALRYRHALLEIDDPIRLIQDWTGAAKMLCLYGTPAWVVCRAAVDRATIAATTSWGREALRRMLRRVGLMYFAWSCPVSAIFWSYVLDPAFKAIFQNVGSDKRFTVDTEEILIDQDVYDQYAAHLTANHPEGKTYLEDPAKTGRQDSDTFFSIAFSIAAVRSHDFLTDAERAQAMDDIGRENWAPVLDAVEVRWR